MHARVPTDFNPQVWAVMTLTPQHTYQVLTKRPDRYQHVLDGPCRCGGGHRPGVDFRRLVQDHAGRLARGAGCEVDLTANWPLANVWLGTSIENDDYARRADALRAVPAAVRFLSLEPLLGPLPSLDLAGIDWVIVGGESGSGFRPLDLDWVRQIRDRCVALGIPLFFKLLCTRDRACQSVRSLRSNAASGGSGGAAVGLDAVLAEQLVQPLELAVHALVLRDHRLDVHAGCPLPLAPRLVGKQPLFPVAQRRGRVEVPRLDRGLLLPPHLGELLRGVHKVDRHGHADQPRPRTCLLATAGQQPQHLLADPGVVGAEPGQHLRGHALALADQPSRMCSVPM